jgi:hypothetical protein
MSEGWQDSTLDKIGVELVGNNWSLREHYTYFVEERRCCDDLAYIKNMMAFPFFDFSYPVPE